MTNKIFGIGLPGSGNKKLAATLNHLGIRTVQNPRNFYQLDEYQGAVAGSITKNYQDLHYLYTNSKFILPYLDPTNWSQELNTISTSTWDNVDSYLDNLQNHIKEVNSFFRRQSENLLLIENNNPNFLETIVNFVKN